MRFHSIVPCMALCAACLSARAADVILDDDMEAEPVTINHKDPVVAKNITGQLPKYWSENTSWNKKVILKYSRESEGGKTFVRVVAEGGHSQFYRQKINDIDNEGLYTIRIRARRKGEGKLDVGLRYMVPPYAFVWKDGFELKESWSDLETEFTPEKPTGTVCLFFYTRGTVDVDHVYLDRTSKTPPRGEGSYYLRKRDVVLALGDATTATGGYLRRVFGSDFAREYPELAKGDDRVRLVNAAEAGATASVTAGKVGALLDKHKPKVVLVCFGASEFYKTRGSFGTGVRSLIAAIRAKRRVDITLLSPPSFYTKSYPELEDHVRSLEAMVAALRSIAAEEKILFADCYTPMRARSDGADFTWGDGVHPNAAGERMMADALRKAWGFGKPVYEFEE